MLAPVWETVPPPAYGGTEAVVAQLTESLVARGHDVTLWASGDSRTSAHHRWAVPFSLRTAEVADRPPHDWRHVAAALNDAVGGNYDLIHNHAGELPLAFLNLVSTPVLSTMHCALTPDTFPLWDKAPGWYSTVSKSQDTFHAPFSGPRYAGHVYNGIDTASFPFSATKDDYLLFLARMAPEKAPHLAIEAARRRGMKLVMAGKCDWRDQQYFETEVKHLIDGESVVYVGEADAKRKRELYRDAKALLLPLQWDEPFGLVMTEAMACGTPVIAFRRGSVPELVVNGRTGFVVDTVDGMVEALGRLSEIDPARCRSHVWLNFDTRAMVDGYLRLFEQIMQDSRPPVRELVTTSPALAAPLLASVS